MEQLQAQLEALKREVRDSLSVACLLGCCGLCGVKHLLTRMLILKQIVEQLQAQSEALKREVGSCCLGCLAALMLCNV